MSTCWFLSVLNPLTLRLRSSLQLPVFFSKTLWKSRPHVVHSQGKFPRWGYFFVEWDQGLKLSKTVPASVAFLFWPLGPLHFSEHMPSWVYQFSCSVVSNSLQPHGLHQDSLSITNSQSLLKLMSITSVMPSYHLIFCHHFLLLPSILHQGLSNKSVLRIRWPKYWSFSFSINPSNEYSGLISFRIDWFELLAVQGTLKNLLQHHSSKHQFFSAQFSL